MENGVHTGNEHLKKNTEIKQQVAENHPYIYLFLGHFAFFTGLQA